MTEEFFYYWKNYQIDTEEQTKPHPKLHRETEEILQISRGDTVWCVASINVGRAPKRIALAAKIVAEKSGSNTTENPDYLKYGPHYFLDGRIGTKYYDVYDKNQSGLEVMLRDQDMSFPVRAKHVGGSFQGKNGFRRLATKDKELFNEFASSLSLHPKIKINMRK